MNNVFTLRALACCLLYTASFTTAAQEGTRPTRYNASQHYNHHKPLPTAPHTRAELPFVDDFSFGQITPDPSKWIGNQVYINRDCPRNPPSIGVATFDGLGANGLAYNPNAGSASKSADTLTSQSINLAGLGPDNNVYLSFVFQPKGLCNAPEAGDSLVLEFRVDSTQWTGVWGTAGFGSSGSDWNYFKSVIVPVNDPVFFTDTFQFRFRNKATVTGNTDHWHIDYVQLDANRNDADTVLNDIAIQYPPPSLLKTYREMPWKQFKANAGNETAQETKIFARNNYNVAQNTTYGYVSTELYSNTQLGNPPLASFNFSELSSQTLTLAPVDLPAVAGNDSALVETRYFAFLSGSADELPSNDTVTHYQRFRDYFAYDDGTSEAAYYVFGLGAKAALRYHLNTADTLQGIRVHWTAVDGSQTDLLFSVVVWKSLFPEVILHQQDFLNAEYVDSVHGFATYLFEEPQPITDTFYVGWSLSQTNGIDIGYDRNTDARQHFWYNLGAGWVHSQEEGAAMMRPIVGSREGLLNTNIGQGPATPGWQSYPNPVSDWVAVSDAPDGSQFELTNAFGQSILFGAVNNERIDLPNLGAGLYFLKVSSGADSKTFRLAKP